jgi:hypothetical protein
MYAIVLVVLSAISLGATFLPFFVSLLLPNPDIKQVVNGLREGGIASMDSESVVDAAKAALGPLTRAIQIGSSGGGSTTFDLSGTHGRTSMWQTAYIYIAWFQKHPAPMTVAITLYTNDRGQKAYGINQVNPVSVGGLYAITVLFFSVSLFLVRKRENPT